MPSRIARVFALWPQALAQTRARIRSADPALAPALNKLRQEAEAATEQAPLSVMDKGAAPPSGDLHDYLSYGPYWWPDPDKPDGLPFIRRDGEVYPGSKTCSDSPALHTLMASVETLALAYYLLRDQRYAAHAARLLRTWFLDPATRMNPHLQYGQAIPGVVEGRGVGIIDTAHLASVVDAVGLLGGSGALSQQDRAGLAAWCRAYLDWLEDSAHGRDERAASNNHGTWYDVQVAALALFARRRKLARQVLAESATRRIAAQVEPDGRQPHELRRTRALSYSTMNLNGLMTLATLGSHVGVDLWGFATPDGRSIRRALDFLAPYADPAREWPFAQITEFDRLTLLPLLRRGSIVYPDAGYAGWVAYLPQDEVSAHRAQLLYPLPPA